MVTRVRNIPEKGQNESLQDLQKNLEEAKQYLREVQAEIQQQEKPAGFFGKLNSALVNSERIAEARHQVRMAELNIELAKAKAKADAEYERYLKSSGINDSDDKY